MCFPFKLVVPSNSNDPEYLDFSEGFNPDALSLRRTASSEASTSRMLRPSGKDSALSTAAWAPRRFPSVAGPRVVASPSDCLPEQDTRAKIAERQRKLLARPMFFLVF